ncbi:MAG: hypothetical protein OEM49_01825 [Myxococcales bacterium]|nr:hypothetical protein [Myxococcales bacterium]MDH5305902.1 hypothetical protein [Myxococcales bacterium]MDH5566022.1 hypothetical protein [Myxococcales bacterium]
MASPIHAIGAALDAAGLNVRGALSAERYDGLVPPAWRTAVLLPAARSAVVVASGGRALWEAFRAAPEFGAAQDPLDAYTARVVGDLAAHWAQAGHPTRALFAFERRGGGVADFVALGRASGLGVHSRLGLLLHPHYGPWLSIRALLLTELAWFESRGEDGFDPCGGCPAPCASACPTRAPAPSGFDVAACAATRRREPDCALRCAARRACPVGAQHAYLEEAEAHHMRDA